MAGFDFDQGVPDPGLYPVDVFRRHFDAVLSADGADACNYFGRGHAEDMRYGHFGLRAGLAEWLNRSEGCALGAANLTLANGSTDGIAMAVNALVGPGDSAVVEEPTYPYARRFIEAAGGVVTTVPLDDDGMDVAQLDAAFEAAAAAGLRPRLVYTVATFHSPTGTVLSERRRRALLEAARRWDAIVLDDNCYYHLYYGAPPPPSLLAMSDPEAGPVVQSGSFSKYLAPGLRMAWLAGPAPVIAAIAGARQDFAVSQLTARVVEGIVRDGGLDAHLSTLRVAYAAKRDAAADALTRYCRPWVDFALPGGGFYFWLRIADDVDSDAAVAGAAAAGVRFRPGVRFADAASGDRFLRLSVAQMSLPHIEEGIALLGRALAGAVR